MSGPCRYRSLPIGFADQNLTADAIALYAAAYTSREMNLCGALFVSKESMAQMAGFKSIMRSRSIARVDRAIADLGQMVKWWPDINVVFFPGFAMMQAANPNIWIGAMKNAGNLPYRVAVVAQDSIINDFIGGVDSSKAYYAETLEKLKNLTVKETVSEPLPKSFLTVPETHARVTRVPTRAPGHAPSTEDTEGTEVTEKTNLSLSTDINTGNKEREVYS
ncbi:hypothetical protein [Mariprofundus ferrooxydans]|uniref:hypothetical protein n=1 Tax=Mariprofundus ferrooxydans TaxID=314344 RepID=UPI00143197EF|nr:hypothetical protein [Mariprofundus ferrooxydans]